MNKLDGGASRLVYERAAGEAQLKAIAGKLTPGTVSELVFAGHGSKTALHLAPALMLQHEDTATNSWGGHDSSKDDKLKATKGAGKPSSSPGIDLWNRVARRVGFGVERPEIFLSSLQSLSEGFLAEVPRVAGLSHVVSAMFSIARSAAAFRGCAPDRGHRGAGCL
jgi:hypothetical protein